MDTPLGSLSPGEFLAEYWQRQPVLIRQAVPGFVNPIDAEELAGLACEPGVRSRLVLGHPDRRDWEVEYGPFDPERFAQLPDTAWTLLVSEIEQYWPDAPDWLRRFDFLPRWRRDDLMVSYAVRDGSVGPHIDAYDVFLFQAQGRRRWQIQEPPPASPICLPALPLAILRSFMPTTQWILEPGDMLYLPPGVPHLGMALDDECMTWSMGFRAPAWRDLVGAFVEDRLEGVGPELVTDPGRSLSLHAHELASDDRAALRSGLLERLDIAPSSLDRFLGEFLTRPNPVRDSSELETEPLPEVREVRIEPCYRFDPELRRFWMHDASGITLFIGGHVLQASGLDREDAERLCASDILTPADWRDRLPGLQAVLRDLLAGGHIEAAPEPAD